MRFRVLIVAVLVLVPAIAFGQTPREKYQEAKAAEFRADNAKKSVEKEVQILQALDAINEAVIADGQYVSAFAEIARKYMRLSHDPNPYYYVLDEIVKVGEKRGQDPTFRSIAQELADGYKQVMEKNGFAPGKPLLQMNRRRGFSHCNIPHAAEQIFNVLRIVRPIVSADVKVWGKYAADAYMTKLRGCGGEGSDLEPNAFQAFPIYVSIHDLAGMHKTGRIVGDSRMERYVFGGYDYETINHDGDHDPGYRLFYDNALKAYREGGVPQNEIRASLLRFLRQAEEHKNDKATAVAQSALRGTF